MKINNGILLVFGPGSPFVVAVGQVLSLQFVRVPGVDGNQTRRNRHARSLAKTAAIVPVDDSASGKNHYAIVFRKRYRQRFPVHQIRADRMSPAHMPPHSSERGTFCRSEEHTSELQSRS